MVIGRRTLFKIAAGATLSLSGVSFLTRGKGLLPVLWQQPLLYFTMKVAPVRNPDILVKNQDKEIILYSRSRQADILKLNVTAGYIWTRCDGSRKLGDIVRDVSRNFDVTPAQCGRDVLFTVCNMQNRGVLL